MRDYIDSLNKNSIDKLIEYKQLNDPDAKKL